MGIDRLVYIRADGNAKIATGHLMRCFSIANACRNQGMKVHFLVSDKESADFLQDNLSAAYPVTILKNASYDNLERELPELLSLFSYARCKDLIYLLDSYFVTEKYLSAIRPVVKLVYVDDLMLFDYPVDLLVNYDIIPESKMPAYKASYRNVGKLLLGAGYAPLREQFQNREMPLRTRASHLLITTGGSDPYHFALTLIRHLSENIFPEGLFPDGLIIHVVIGAMSPDKEALYELGQSLPSLKLYEHLARMASLMESCDLAVSASGTTLYELCALGVPAISFTMADNQLPSAKAFAEIGAIPYAGDIRHSMEQVLDKICLFLSDLSKAEPSSQTDSLDSSFIKRKTAHETMRSLIDGNGSLRIAREIQRL